MNCQIFHSDLLSPTTAMLSVCLSRTNILAWMPLLRKASINRLAAIAAPPILSDVFIISTLMLCKVFTKVVFFGENLCGMWIISLSIVFRHERI